MPYRLLLTRIKKLFRAGAGPYFKSVEDGFKSRRLKLPAQPMTDLELARAIREFQAKPVSDWTLRKPGVALRAPEWLHKDGRSMNEQPTTKRNCVKHAITLKERLLEASRKSAGHRPQTTSREGTSNAASIGARKRSGGANL